MPAFSFTGASDSVCFFLLFDLDQLICPTWVMVMVNPFIDANDSYMHSSLWVPLGPAYDQF